MIESEGRACGLDMEIVSGDPRPLMVACDFAIVASGTASLELAYFETPMVVLYRLPRLWFRFFQFVRVTPWFALPNILGCSVTGGEPTVMEKLLTGDISEEVIRRARALIDDDDERGRAVECLRRLKESALQPGGIESAASTLLSFLEEQGGEQSG